MPGDKVVRSKLMLIANSALERSVSKSKLTKNRFSFCKVGFVFRRVSWEKNRRISRSFKRNCSWCGV